MNDLILTIAKDRILPVNSNIIDFPNESFVNQLYRLIWYITDNIIRSLNSLELSNITLQTKLLVVLYSMFPLDWLEIAKTSPNDYIDIKKLYKTNLNDLTEEDCNLLNRILEFLCFEIIETTILCNIENDIDINLFETTPRYILTGIEQDPVLKQIVKNQRIYMIDSNQIPDIKISTDLRLSNKSHRLVKIFINQLLEDIIENRKHENLLTLEDIDTVLN